MFAEKVGDAAAMSSRGSANDERSQRFAQAVLARFQQLGRVNDRVIASHNGPSTTYMTQLRNAAKGEGLVPRPRTPTQVAIESVAEWAPGSTLAVWEGREPVTVGADPHTDENFVSAPGERVNSGTTDSAVLDAIEAMRRDMQEMSERLARLEGKDA